MIQLQEGFRGCPFSTEISKPGRKVKNTVLTKVERNLVSKMSDDTKKRQQQLFLSNGLL